MTPIIHTFIVGCYRALPLEKKLVRARDLEESHLGNSTLVTCGKAHPPVAPRQPDLIERRHTGWWRQGRTLMRKGVRGRGRFEQSLLQPVNGHDFDPAIHLEGVWLRKLFTDIEGCYKLLLCSSRKAFRREPKGNS